MNTTRMLVRQSSPCLWRKQILVYSLLAVVLFLIRTPSYADLILNDGGVHNINYYVGGTILVYNNVNAPFDPTVVNIYSGANFNHLEVNGNSIANIYGGNFHSFYGYMDGPKINMYGGNLDGASRLYSGSLNMYGGHLEDFLLTGGSFSMKGGSIVNNVIDGGHTTIYDGLSHPLFIGGGKVKILGGEIYFDGEWGIRNGVVKIYGGYLESPVVIYDSQVTLYGKSFSLPFGKYTASDDITGLSGILRDGSFLNWDSITPLLGDGGTLRLARVPEPSTLLLLGSGLVGLMGYGRKKRFN